jgi:hypothetical protein
LKKVKSADDNFTDTLENIGVFLQEVVSAVLEERPFTKKWSATNGKWQ